MTALAELVTMDVLDDDPYPILGRLREHEPVAWIPALGRYVVTSRSLVVAMLRDPETFTTDSPASPIRSTFGPQMLSTDSDEQRRHRAPFQRAFRPKVVRDDHAERIVAFSGELIDRFGDATAELAPWAGAIAVRTVMDRIGTDAGDVDVIRAWYDDLAGALANIAGDADVARRGARTAEIVRAYLADAPLLHEASELLDADACGSNALLILFGGIETTESMILNAVWSLLSHPDELAKVCAEPALVGRAVEESLRWEPAVQTLTRYATRDAELGGVEIARGCVVDGMIGGANRDATHFEDPERFDVTRANAGDHLTFGFGRHTCLGIHLARLEASIALRTLLDRSPGLRLDDDRPCRPRGHEFRKVRPLWVRWDA